MSFQENYFAIDYFNDANLIFKANEVFGYGDYIDHFTFEEYSVFLYAYSDFYIEVIHQSEQDSICLIQGINSEEAVDKYMPDLKIQEEYTKILQELDAL